MNNQDVSLKEKSIVFIGFMGAGKTTIGRLVAKKLYRDFIDIDEEIENEFKMPVSQIFAEIGEKAFREREKTITTCRCQQKLQVISIGGGAYLQEEIKKVCLSSCIVIYLDISWESLKKRLGIIIKSRPVLQGKSIEEIEELFYKRKEGYFPYHSKVEIDNQSMDELADEIVKSLKLSWELHEA
ncbi:shikimate kinase [Neobacillus sp. FSL H8-0543]|uniref:shikimate kinase n=1 Tax=Neobacillus sp. FSL H8-0543 TaxID=2954672 RepID=UPI0031592174